MPQDIPSWQHRCQKGRVWPTHFLLSAGGILLLTGTAKMASAFGGSEILRLADPVFGIPFRYLMLTVGLLEFLVAGICLFTSRRTLSLGLVAWLATNVVAYRSALWLVGWRRPCNCLGSLLDAVHIPPQLADSAIKFLLAYLIIGSWLALLWTWKQSKRESLMLNDVAASAGV